MCAGTRERSLARWRGVRAADRGAPIGWPRGDLQVSGKSRLTLCANASRRNRMALGRGRDRAEGSVRLRRSRAMPVKRMPMPSATLYRTLSPISSAVTDSTMRALASGPPSTARSPGTRSQSAITRLRGRGGAGDDDVALDGVIEFAQPVRRDVLERRDDRDARRHQRLDELRARSLPDAERAHRAVADRRGERHAHRDHDLLRARGSRGSPSRCPPCVRRAPRGSRSAPCAWRRRSRVLRRPRREPRRELRPPRRRRGRACATRSRPGGPPLRSAARVRVPDHPFHREWRSRWGPCRSSLAERRRCRMVAACSRNHSSRRASGSRARAPSRSPGPMVTRASTTCARCASPAAARSASTNGAAKNASTTPRCPPTSRRYRSSPVGRYAIRIDWSDGHTTGIYPFRRLRELCSCERAVRRAESAQRARRASPHLPGSLR